jgi:putative oxidoreductase
MNTQTQSTHSHWLLRIAVASVFIFHGVGKLANLQGTSAMMQLPFFIVLLVALAETGGGLLVLLGGLGKDRVFDLATRLGAAMNIPVMLGAIFMVHWGRWNFVASEEFPMGGMEFQVVLLLILSYLAINGNRQTA